MFFLRRARAYIQIYDSPTSSAHWSAMTATEWLAVVRTIDQHAADAGLAHFTEGDLLRTVRHQERASGWSKVRSHRRKLGQVESRL
jgi:hypothetical protein